MNGDPGGGGDSSGSDEEEDQDDDGDEDSDAAVDFKGTEMGSDLDTSQYPPHYNCAELHPRSFDLQTLSTRFPTRKPGKGTVRAIEHQLRDLAIQRPERRASQLPPELLAAPGLGSLGPFRR
ncbi:hypothetical protein PR003_g6619 [Phytophthora rubi]|uniref:Uncharacterized protein n=1 Tax=Phytophthora rubi TaxID=129364 RepID=A0A6A3MUK1_9STRA|nr:hypothetical protein PR002_g8851 [Phytophthora rubi]KAE9348057.1 hypothetical protein PR003_g6619 [Phytophthora rubi]